MHGGKQYTRVIESIGNDSMRHAPKLPVGQGDPCATPTRLHKMAEAWLENEREQSAGVANVATAFPYGNVAIFQQSCIIVPRF
jgi:hypothetical protein